MLFVELVLWTCGVALPTQETAPAPAAIPQSAAAPASDAGKDQAEDVLPIAFSAYLEGSQAPPIDFTVKEWDEYTGFLRGMHGIDDEGVYINKMLGDILQCLAIRLYFFQELLQTEERAREVIRNLERGQSFARMVKVYSDNQTSKQFDGDMGRLHPGQWFYPVNHLVFVTPEGSWTPAMHTQNGMEIYLVRKRGGTPGTLDQWAEVSYIHLRIPTDMPLNAGNRAKILRGLRLRTQDPRFARILPPAIQDPRPTKFGPEDVAPLGGAALPLSQVSDLESRNGKRIINGKPVDLAQAADAAAKQRP